MTPRFERGLMPSDAEFVIVVSDGLCLSVHPIAKAWIGVELGSIAVADASGKRSIALEGSAVAQVHDSEPLMSVTIDRRNGITVSSRSASLGCKAVIFEQEPFRLRAPPQTIGAVSPDMKMERWWPTEVGLPAPTSPDPSEEPGFEDVAVDLRACAYVAAIGGSTYANPCRDDEVEIVLRAPAAVVGSMMIDEIAEALGLLQRGA